MGMRGLGAPDVAEADPMSAASTNFLASAVLVARRLPDALLVDMGSTTTDIIAVRGGTIAARGLTDGDRLRTGELVYTGLTRTDVSLVAHRGTFQERTQRLAAGGFANMADVRRILGEFPDGVDQHATLDGRGKSIEESIARFARCFGRDASDAHIDDWRASARDIAEQQEHEIRLAIDEVLSAGKLPPDAPIIAAGVGADVIERVARDLGRASRRFGTIAQANDDCREWATRCAPAVAVAFLSDSAG
jgi:probable H4MPT-linked C1 transfer pathway protein